MREMKDSGVEWIGEIPKDWKVLRNKNTFGCSKELVGEKSSITQLLSLTTKGIKEKDINNPVGKLPETFDTYQLVKLNELVMCLFDLDCSAVFSGISSHLGMISPAYRVLTCLKNMKPTYADYWFKYISDGRKFNHYAKNIRYTISLEEFKTLPILVPNIEIQKHISDYLDTKCSKIDAIIAREQSVIEKLKEYKLSVITEAVTKGLNPNVPMKDSKIEWIGEIPEGWKTIKFKTVFSYAKGLPITKADLLEKGIAVISYGQIHSKKSTGLHISDELIRYVSAEYLQSNPNSIAYYGDILFADTSEDYLGIGNCIYNDSNNNIFAGYHTIITRPNNDKVFSKYQAFLFKSDVWRSQLRSIANGIKVYSITQKMLNKVYVIVPPILDQQQIADYLDNKCTKIDSAIIKKQSVIEKLIEYKKSLIYEVVTGKKEV